MRARKLRWLLNIWPPYLFTGIRIPSLDAEFRRVRVELRAWRIARNYFGTHFGGSLFAMTDPFHTLLLLHRLGPRYLVWDASSEIEFVSPGRGTVACEIEITDDELVQIQQQAAEGSAVFRDYQLEILDAAAHVVARVRKRVYVRLKREHRPGLEASTGRV